MFNIAAPVWNQIAPLAQNQTWQVLMAMDQQRQAWAMEAIAEALQARNLDSQTVLAYMALAPLLQEHQAITTYLAPHPQYLLALPEMLKIDETLLMADQLRLPAVSQTRGPRRLPRRAPAQKFNV